MKAAPKPKVLEKHIAQAVTEFLRIDEWRVFKQEPLSRAGGGRYAGELGMPDLLALRYLPPAKIQAVERPIEVKASCGHIWLEIKRPGAKPKPHQVAWHEREVAHGALVWIVDDFDMFRTRYLASGLARRVR